MQTEPSLAVGSIDLLEIGDVRPVDKTHEFVNSYCEIAEALLQAGQALKRLLEM